MLIQLPSGTSDQRSANAEEDCDAFEAGLRRDLASAPMVSYDSVLGGWSKRAVDASIALISLPVWASVALIAAGWAKMRRPNQTVLHASERIGYGGRAFKCLRLSIGAASAPRNDATGDEWHDIADQAEGRRAKWRRALERLPQMYNVLVGDMALVGPSPLSHEALEPLRTARRYYLSARPGIVGVHFVANADVEDASHYKIYAMSWSLSTDALILWDALRSLRNRGELWKPSFKLTERRSSNVHQISARRRSAE